MKNLVWVGGLGDNTVSQSPKEAFLNVDLGFDFRLEDFRLGLEDLNFLLTILYTQVKGIYNFDFTCFM